MLKFFKSYKPFFIILPIISGIIIAVFYKNLKVEKRLPYYQPAMVDTLLVEPSIRYVKKYHRIADFSLINQNGDTITQEFYKNKIYVADFFFTTCQDICLKMTSNMSYMQERIKNDSQVMLLSHTVTPEIDTIAQLKKYAIKNKVIDSKWNLVTGDKKQIYNLARKSYLVAKKNPSQHYDMIHTENFVLVDKERRIRGFYDGTDRNDIDQLLDDIQLLKKEE